MLVCIDSIVSLRIAIVPLLVVPTPCSCSRHAYRAIGVALFPSASVIASPSPSVAVVSEPARFDEEIVPFKGVLNWFDLPTNK
jgi:hypothetical protein